MSKMRIQMQTENNHKKPRKEMLEREERFRAQMILAGRSDAGQIPQPPKEETAKEYKDRVMRGE